MNDRCVYEEAFIRSLRSRANVTENPEFYIYVCDLMKNQASLISYLLFKKKVLSNLRNYVEIPNVSTTKIATFKSKK